MCQAPKYTNNIPLSQTSSQLLLHDFVFLIKREISSVMFDDISFLSCAYMLQVKIKFRLKFFN